MKKDYQAVYDEARDLVQELKEIYENKIDHLCEAVWKDGIFVCCGKREHRRGDPCPYYRLVVALGRAVRNAAKLESHVGWLVYELTKRDDAEV